MNYKEKYLKYKKKYLSLKLNNQTGGTNNAHTNAILLVKKEILNNNNIIPGHTTQTTIPYFQITPTIPGVTVNEITKHLTKLQMYNQSTHIMNIRGHPNKSGGHIIYDNFIFIDIKFKPSISAHLNPPPPLPPSSTTA